MTATEALCKGEKNLAILKYIFSPLTSPSSSFSSSSVVFIWAEILPLLSEVCPCGHRESPILYPGQDFRPIDSYSGSQYEAFLSMVLGVEATMACSV